MRGYLPGRLPLYFRLMCQTGLKFTELDTLEEPWYLIQGRYVLPLSLYVRRKLEKLSPNFDEIFGGVDCVSS